MKFSVVTFLLSALLCAQAPAPQGSAPPPAIPGAPPAVPPDTVVAEIGGKKYTAAELDKLISGMPVQFQPAIRANPKNLTQIFVFRELEHMALADKLEQQSPYKEQLEFMRTQYLAQTEAQSYRYSKIAVSTDEEQKFYEAHKADKYRQAKVRVIYVAFRPPTAQTEDAKKQPTEAEAKAKAEDLRKQLQSGADFAALAKANSDDKSSAEKGGDYGLITQASSSDALKKAAFSLKVGEISEPLRQPAGFYLVRVDEFLTQPFDQVESAINEEVRNEKFSGWNQELQSKYAVKVENQNYFAPRPMPAGMQPQPPIPGRPVVPPGAK